MDVNEVHSQLARLKQEHDVQYFWAIFYGLLALAKTEFREEFIAEQLVLRGFRLGGIDPLEGEVIRHGKE